MGEPSSPDCVFDFPMDEPEPHPVYDFFTPGPLPGYAGDPNNNNGWIKADVPLLGEFGAEVDEPMIDSVIDEVAKPIVKEEEQMVAPVIDVEEDIAMLFGDDDFSDDDSERFEDDKEVWEVNEEWLIAPVTPSLMRVVPLPSTYEVGGPSTAAEGQSFTLLTHGFPVPPSVIKDLSTHMGCLVIMGESLSPDRLFDFFVDEPESHPAYDFFAPELLPGYVGNPNNNNGWIEADVPLLGELGAEADERMVGLMIDEIAEPIVLMEEQMIALVIDAEEDIAMVFRDDDFSDDDSEGVEEEEVWEVNEEWLMAPVTPPLMPVVPQPSVYENLITRLGDIEYGHGQLVKKVIQVSDAEVAAGISIEETGPRVFPVEGHVQAVVQQRDTQIQQLKTMVSEMSSRESKMMQCILGMDMRLADLKRRPPRP
uniref:Uncharacterized protein n=1 Tax=Tanacetum cinerariifolium TaxID=118510 RepID=A0A6L2MZ99_TANCI|nr:hypothetical protein [Tanacetum cinerariifolium]